MALPATDNFNRADENPLNANWTGTLNNWRVISNQAQGTTFNYSAIYWSADAFGNDHYSQAVNKQVSDAGPAVRVSAGPKSYHFDAKAGSNTVMQKDVNGTFTNLQTGLATPAVNDLMYIEAVGTTIKMKINGSQIGTDQTDSALATGSAGLWTYDTTGIVDDFQGDNLGAAGRTTKNTRSWPLGTEIGMGWRQEC